MNGQFCRWKAMRYIRIPLIVAIVTFVGGNFATTNAKSEQDIRLVLQVTVDGLRADLIKRYEKGFGKGGQRFECLHVFFC